MSARPDTLRAELCEAFGVTVVHVARTGSWIAIAERGDAKYEVTRPTRAGAEDAALDLCGAPLGTAQSPARAPYPICGKVRHRTSASGHDYTAACQRTEACDVADCPLRPATPADEAGVDLPMSLWKAARQYGITDHDHDHGGATYEMLMAAQDGLEREVAAFARARAASVDATPADEAGALPEIWSTALSEAIHMLDEGAPGYADALRAISDHLDARAASAVPEVVREAVQRQRDALRRRAALPISAIVALRMTRDADALDAWLAATAPGAEEGAACHR